MGVDKLTPTDSRVQHKFSTLNGRKYHYLLAEPHGDPKGTIFLVHGWPDMAFGWRYQIPFLTTLGLRVVAPDMQGYGQSGAPQPLTDYTLKAASDDIAALAKELNSPEIFILGHDWGGAVVWRFALWYPEMVKSVISICTPYWAPAKEYVPLEEQVNTVLPNFKYQLQLAGPDVEREIVGKEKQKQFATGMSGGTTPEGKPMFDISKGVIFENLASIQPGGLLNSDEIDFYAEEFTRNGMRGPLNWYRTRKHNYDEEKVLAGKDGLKVQPPSLFVLATKDAALPPAMSVGMEKNFVDLTRAEVKCSHWALWEAPEEVNKLIGNFLDKQIGGSTNSKI